MIMNELEIIKNLLDNLQEYLKPIEANIIQAQFKLQCKVDLDFEDSYGMDSKVSKLEIVLDKDPKRLSINDFELIKSYTRKCNGILAFTEISLNYIEYTSGGFLLDDDTFESELIIKDEDEGNTIYEPSDYMRCIDFYFDYDVKTNQFMIEDFYLNGITDLSQIPDKQSTTYNQILEGWRSYLDDKTIDEYKVKDCTIDADTIRDEANKIQNLINITYVENSYQIKYSVSRIIINKDYVYLDLFATITGRYLDTNNISRYRHKLNIPIALTMHSIFERTNQIYTDYISSNDNLNFKKWIYKRLALVDIKDNNDEEDIVIRLDLGLINYVKDEDAKYKFINENHEVIAQVPQFLIQSRDLTEVSNNINEIIKTMIPSI